MEGVIASRQTLGSQRKMHIRSSIGCIPPLLFVRRPMRMCHMRFREVTSVVANFRQTDVLAHCAKVFLTARN
jgi:hypothetical protein